MINAVLPLPKATSTALSHRVHSFDVFDTTLTRLVGRPTSLFFLLGQTLLAAGKWSGSAEQFARARIEAEERARRNTKSQEVTLEAIYRELTYSYGLSTDVDNFCISSEILLETRLLRPVPRILALLSELRAERKTIFFISDTYFPKETVESWLRDMGAWGIGDQLWASSTFGLTKHSGDLFTEVIAQSNISPNSIIHLGDNLDSDVAVPASLGIRSRHFADCQLTRYEMLMEDFATDTRGISALFAGASRWVRLSLPTPDEKTRALRDLAAQVAGPVICAFVVWVLLQAKIRGLHRLLFTSRDGQIMLKVAKRLAPKLEITTELEYFYGGRQLLNLAGLRNVTPQAIEWITESASLLTLSDILNRVGLAVSDVETNVDHHKLPRDGKIPTYRIKDLQAFFADPGVAEKIRLSAERRRAYVKKYLVSCGLTESFPCGIVDIGWKGRVFNAIREVLGPTAGNNHTGIYFGLFAKPRNPKGLEAFLFDLSVDPPLGLGGTIPSLANVMEIFCQGDHGPVVDVTADKGGYSPVIRAEKDIINPNWDVPYFHQSVEAYADALELNPDSIHNLDLRPMCEKLLRTLLTTPSYEEASILGSFNYNDDQDGIVSQRFAEPYLATDFRAAFRSGYLPHKHYVWWVAGATAMTPPATRAILRFAIRLSRLRATVIWRIIHRGFSAARDLARRIQGAHEKN